MEKLGSVILHKGITHPGWSCPEGWMAGCLSEDNQKAKNQQRKAEADVAKAKGSNATKTFAR
jgi:hypothetical protein